MKAPKFHLDKFDRGILRLLQENNRVSSEALAAAVGLSSTAVQRRVRKMRAGGVITADVSVVAPAAAGLAITAIVAVVLERGGAAAVDGFRKDVRRFEEIQQCYYVSGDADFMLVVTAADMPAYENFTQRCFFASKHIRKFHTTFVLDPVKVGLAVPIA